MRLLILDINGLLCCKVSKDHVPDARTEILELGKYNVILRPHARKFLECCYRDYTVAFFSSTTYTNANLILEKLLTAQQKESTCFRWFRDRTRLDSAGNKDYDTIKNLADVFDNPVINEKRIFNWSNTLLCDDSKIKTRFNPDKNIIIFKAFEGDPDDNILLEMMDVISERFIELQLEKLTL